MPTPEPAVAPEPAIAPAPALAPEPAIPVAPAVPEATDVRVKRTGTFQIATWTSLLLSLALPLIPLIFIAQFYLVRFVFGPADLVIGADGVIVKQRLRSRFVPFEDLDSVTTAVNAVTLHLRDGSVLRARARNLDSASQTAIQERITQALSLRRDQGAEAGAIARLDKGARTGVEWRAALSKLLVQDGDYRAARLTREQVLRVLENPGAPVGRRLGAAIALARSQDPEVRTRARIAAAASANDRIRIAFERVAEGALDDAAIDEAAEAETSGAVAGEAGDMLLGSGRP